MAMGEYTMMYDSINPGFRRAIKDGKVFMNPMSKVTQIGVRRGGIGPQRTQLNAPQNCSGSIQYPQVRDVDNQVEVLYSAAVGQGFTVGRLPIMADLLGSSISRALTECSTSVQNARGRADGNLWETLAEADKALGTLTGVFKSARKVIQARHPPGLAKEITANYLAWRYGIKPLISDTKMVIDGLQKKVGRVRKTTRAKVQMSDYRSRTVKQANEAFGTDILENTFDNVVIRATSLDEHVLTEANNVGLTSKGLITLPWELVRLSFVLDWFTTVGDFLGAITPAFGWTQLGSCYVVTREQRVEIDAINCYSTSSNYRLDVPCSGGFTYHLNTKRRVVGLPAPGIVIRSDFRFSNLTRCLDAFSLLAQQVFKRK
jgi:hypothetical protein